MFNKSLFIVCISILLISLYSFNNSKNNESCFEIYICDSVLVDGVTNFNKFILPQNLLISNDDIILYDWNHNEIDLHEIAWNKVNDKFKILREARINEVGLPFIVTINKKIVYDGIFWSKYSSLKPPDKPLIKTSSFKEKRFRINYDYMNISDSLTIKNKEIYDCLKAAGKIKE